MICEKVTNGVTCGRPAANYIEEKATRQIHWYCDEHSWEASPVNGIHTCTALGGNPPEYGPCGKPAVLELTNPVGEVIYYCEECHRKYRPTEAEKAADRTRAKANQVLDGALGCLQLLLVVVLLVGVVFFLFIHPLLMLLAAALIAIIWHELRTSR